ncbi:hypothetical protein NM208_g3304 [Fusarium decemcellulare]|uniref:Uncharacterized protein n=1 Tax=Fusarium decemcellulare TaxID=57161 RepID=A0ACC1SPF7_9HYPO|nr:hypothetical protein NM208_g3304 [Fusarium decemcellulare]
MAYARWVYILIQIQRGMSSNPITLWNAHLNWGKFYQYDNKDQEVSTDSVEKTSISSGSSTGIAACGRSDASSGTEGNFELWDGDVKICKVYWDCPWGSKKNTFTVSEVNEDFIVEESGANLDSGAIGNVTVKIGKWL